jgi:hypothetical protein
VANGIARSQFALIRLIATVITLVSLIALEDFPVRAQGFAAAITGTVKDTSGAAVPGE